MLDGPEQQTEQHQDVEYCTHILIRLKRCMWQLCNQVWWREMGSSTTSKLGSLRCGLDLLQLKHALAIVTHVLFHSLKVNPRMIGWAYQSRACRAGPPWVSRNDGDELEAYPGSASKIPRRWKQWSYACQTHSSLPKRSCKWGHSFACEHVPASLLLWKKLRQRRSAMTCACGNLDTWRSW